MLGNFLKNACFLKNRCYIKTHNDSGGRCFLSG